MSAGSQASAGAISDDLPRQVPVFRPDGSLLDLLNVQPGDIDFAEIANALSKINRFNGRCKGPGYPVAQHCVMGADAVLAETGQYTLAAAFLLHDAHEYLTGDIITPMVRGMDAVLCGGRAAAALDTIKRRIDRAIAIRLAAETGMDVAPILCAPTIKAMDRRMFDAEIMALFGPKAEPSLLAPYLPAPKLCGAIRPWGPAKAEEAWLNRLRRFTGLEVRPMAA